MPWEKLHLNQEQTRTLAWLFHNSLEPRSLKDGQYRLPEDPPDHRRNSYLHTGYNRRIRVFYGRTETELLIKVVDCDRTYPSIADVHEYAELYEKMKRPYLKVNGTKLFRLSFSKTLNSIRQSPVECLLPSLKAVSIPWLPSKKMKSWTELLQWLRKFHPLAYPMPSNQYVWCRVAWMDHSVQALIISFF